MEQIVAWCPQSGQALSNRFPFCMKDGTPTPLYVEVNALAQFFPGTPTHLEFLFLNASDGPVSLDRFDVRLGDTELEPGIHPEGRPRTVDPGEDNVVLADRVVNLDISQVTAGQHTLHITVAFTCPKGPFTMKGAHPVVFDVAGSQKIHFYNPADETVTVCPPEELPATHRCTGVEVGEARTDDKATRFIADLKTDEGLRFVPLRMAYDNAAATGATPSAAAQAPPAAPAQPDAAVSSARCPACGAEIAENGRYCPDCGVELAVPVQSAGPVTSPVGYCPNCPQPRALRARHRFCPFDGKEIHLYVEINEIPFYMEGVQTNTEFRLIPVCDAGIEIAGFRVFSEGTELKKGLYGIGAKRTCTKDDPPLRLDRLLRPPEQGQTVLELELEYCVGRKRFTLRGRHMLNVLPRDADARTIITNIDNSVKQEGDGVSSATRYSNLDLDFGGLGGEGKAHKFIERLKEDHGLNYRPVMMQLAKERKPVRVPDWPPSERACLVFDQQGVRQNYCLLAGRSLGFGRKGHMDVRLYEVERCLPLVERQAAQGVPLEKRASHSVVSGEQWRIEPTNNGVRITQLSSQDNASLVPGAALRKDETRLIGRNEGAAIRDGFGIEVVGLMYTANAPAFEGLDAAFAEAEDVLRQMKPPPGSIERWRAEYGGYRLSRRASLTGELFEGAEKYRALETYVLMPGWCTIGSSDDACIVVRGHGVMPIHAQLLHLSGYFFIRPCEGAASTWIGDEQLEAESLLVLKPGDRLRLGDVPVEFTPFAQCFM
ncbi:MAG: zinc ribbon domain-containing protein [Candidatus Hydrogenedentes bacterium]|nr:zinc ribbon domain-containing protein [Candidatus Hydrogenedentota bacterium]